MFYINQYDYPHIPYPHPEGIYTDMEPTIATSGCGLCSLCIVVNNMTMHRLTIEECLRLSMESGGNCCQGTRMRNLGPYAAPRFGLTYENTRDADALKNHLQKGGMAIICVDGDTDRGVGLFSHNAHYIVALSWDGEDVCILDPAYRPGKFDEEGRQGKVRVREPFLYCSFEDLVNDTLNGMRPFSLFARQK